MGLAACLTACAPSGDTPDSTEILWDEWGVPHIFAHDSETLFYALGWAQARSHGDLLLELIGKARGRAAEYWGGPENLASDRWVRTMGVPARAERWYAAQGSFQAYLDAFAAFVRDSAMVMMLRRAAGSVRPATRGEPRLGNAPVAAPARVRLGFRHGQALN